MAISNNPFMKGVRGAIGKQLVFREFGNKTVISAYPNMSGHKRTAAQKKQNNKMRRANIECKLIMADEQKRNAAQLRLNVTSNRLYHALMKELMKEMK